jgi:hypothetical protein
MMGFSTRPRFVHYVSRMCSEDMSVLPSHSGNDKAETRAKQGIILDFRSFSIRSECDFDPLKAS